MGPKEPTNPSLALGSYGTPPPSPGACRKAADSLVENSPSFRELGDFLVCAGIAIL